MRISVTRHSGVSLTDQIATQIILAISSGELRPAEKLPSIRALATRLRVHSNSVRAAYISLAERHWIGLRQGSGAYVLPPAAAAGIDALTHAYINEARRAGFDAAAIHNAVERGLACSTCEVVIVCEPEPELRDILVAELAEAVQTRVHGTDTPVASDFMDGRALTVSLAARAPRTASGREAGKVDIWLQGNSAADLVRGEPKPPPEALVTFVSRSPTLLRLARAVLSSSGWDPESLVLRDARQPGWKRGLKTALFTVADTVVAREVPGGIAVKRLRLIAPGSLDKVREAIQTRLAPPP